jgi:N6-L-threonylcarbamoyladenine synthase
MNILGIETSCDETAAAIVKDGTTILSNVVASSAEMHVKSGGVIPEVAARQQIKSILPVLQEALSAARDIPSAISSIDAIAVTVGPGLIGSLLVGVETAKTLSYLWHKPIIPVNHLAAHIYANWITIEQETRLPARQGKRVEEYKQPEFPAIALVVSGGHTDLVLMKDHHNLKWVGGTRDDAAGEAFDKTARLLGLPYPGGPSIAAAAIDYQPSTINNSPINLPRPMIDENNFDFSFSGLKTAVLREVNNLKAQQQTCHAKLQRSVINYLASEVQEAICDCLVTKTLKAVKKYKPKSLLLAGGVSANSRLREKFNLALADLAFSINFFVPPPKLCTDNAAAIASYAYFSSKGGLPHYSPTLWQKIEVNPELTIISKV